MRVPGVDAERFAEAVQSQGILGYLDTLSGGSISRVGIFSLGTAPDEKACPAENLCCAMENDRRSAQTKICGCPLIDFERDSLDGGESVFHMAALGSCTTYGASLKDI